MTRTPRFFISVIVLTAAVTFAGCAAEAQPAPTSSGSTPDAAAAAASCVEKGGDMQYRQPTFGTNNAPSSWVELGDPVPTCRFRMGEGDSATAIYVDPVTLSSPRPTLAALAYLAKAPVPQVAPANPASQLCVDLGGAVSYGNGAEGGGLVQKDDPIEVVAVCTFADGSFIDEWGIAYYSAGTVRGADLKPLFRFDTDKVPGVFAGAAG